MKIDFLLLFYYKIQLFLPIECILNCIINAICIYINYIYNYVLYIDIIAQYL